MKRTLVCAILFALALMFVGCGNDSFITLTRNAMFTDLPEAAGWSFSTQKQNEKLKITAGETKILAVLALDTGNGVRSIDLDAIDQKDYDCIVIIRAEFK